VVAGMTWALPDDRPATQMTIFVFLAFVGGVILLMSSVRIFADRDIGEYGMHVLIGRVLQPYRPH
jgi:hypothetical protein